MTLQAALDRHQITDYNQIGTSQWTYLSYDATQGWDVVKFKGILGFFQQIFRWLGYYGSTHLSVIARQIEHVANVSPELLNKIRLSWHNKGNAPFGATMMQPLVLPPVQEARVPTVRDPNIANHSGVYVDGTLLSIEEIDITQVPRVKAIVNAANEACLGGGGIDGIIHRAAGAQLLADCRRLPELRPGVRCPTGQAVITRSGNLGQNIERVIHTVGPNMNIRPENGEELLRNAYRNSLELALRNGIRSIAFPAISIGIFNYPFNEGIQVAIQTIEDYLHEHPNWFNEVKLVFVNHNLWENAVAASGQIAHPHATAEH